MKTFIVTFLSGLLFGVGLTLSGMTQPSKVIGFLDFFGNWDPSLAFVMGGAILVHGISHRFILKQSSPFLAPKFYLPAKSDVEWQLIAGSALFGIGWGLAGLCPGPAVVSIVTGNRYILYFVASMFTGIVVYRSLFARFLAPSQVVSQNKL